MRIYIPILAPLSALAQAIIQEPMWIMSGSENITTAPRLSHPALQESPTDDLVHISPSNRSYEFTSQIPMDLRPILPYPGFWTCPHDTATPPNTEDCRQLIADTYRDYGDTAIDVPADRCIQRTYRSCLMYTCASACEGFRWNMGEWYRLAMYVQQKCVWGRGGGGYIQQQPGGPKERVAYRTGLAHVDEADRLATPAIVC